MKATAYPPRTIVVALGLAALAFAACQEKEPKSPDDVDSTERSYAASYPDKLTHQSSAIHSREAKAKEEIGTMPTFNEQLADDAPPEKVLAILDAADAAGRDGG